MLQKPITRAPFRAEVEGRETKAIKQAMLASNHFETGASSLEHYSHGHKQQETHIVDLVVAGLPSDAQSETLKTISGSKHVISATVDEDNFLGTCKGTGRI